MKPATWPVVQTNMDRLDPGAKVRFGSMADAKYVPDRRSNPDLRINRSGRPPERAVWRQRARESTPIHATFEPHCRAYNDPVFGVPRHVKSWVVGPPVWRLKCNQVDAWQGCWSLELPSPLDMRRPR